MSLTVCQLHICYVDKGLSLALRAEKREIADLGAPINHYAGFSSASWAENPFIFGQNGNSPPIIRNYISK